MKKLAKAVARFLKNEDGPTAVEYAVMLALIIVVCIAAITTLGLNASNTFNYIAGIVAPTGFVTPNAFTGAYPQPELYEQSGRPKTDLHWSRTAAVPG